MNAGPARITRDLPAKAVKPTGRRHPRALLACGTLAVALALTACGGSGKSSSTATRSTTITSGAVNCSAVSGAIDAIAVCVGGQLHRDLARQLHQLVRR